MRWPACSQGKCPALAGLCWGPWVLESRGTRSGPPRAARQAKRVEGKGEHREKTRRCAEGGRLHVLGLPAWPAAGGVCSAPSQTDAWELSQAHTVGKGQGPTPLASRDTGNQALAPLPAHRPPCGPVHRAGGRGLALEPYWVKASGLGVSGGACCFALADAAPAPSPASGPRPCMEASGELPSLICLLLLPSLLLKDAWSLKISSKLLASSVIQRGGGAGSPAGRSRGCCSVSAGHKALSCPRPWDEELPRREGAGVPLG